MNASQDNKIDKNKKKSSRVSKACNTCRVRKIKCNGKNPCESCAHSGVECTFDDRRTQRTTLYKNEDDIRKDLRTLTTCVNALSKLKSIDPAKLDPLVNDLQAKLNGFRNDMRLTVETSKVAEYDADPSIETELLDSDPIRFSRFIDAVIDENELKPVVDGYFGLYSPLSLLTNQGFGWLFKKLFNSNLDHSKVKMTFYLYMRFFDLSNYCSNQTTKNIKEPLKTYKEEYVLSSVECTEQDIVDRMLNRYFLLLDMPQDKTIECDDPKAILGFLNEQIDNVRKFSTLAGTNPQMLGSYYEVDHILGLLSKKCEHILRITTHSDLQISKLLLGQIGYSNDRDENGHGREVISIVVQNLITIGLNRWEYYVGLDETTANDYRLLWWRSVWWDRWASVSTGKPFMIDEKISLCLLPREWVRLGLNEQMSCEMLLNTVDFTGESVTDEIFVDVSQHILSKLITIEFQSILYNSEFTDYKIFSTKYPFFEKALHDLLSQIEQLIWKFAKLDELMKPHIGDLVPENPRFHVYLTMKYCNVEALNMIESILIRFTTSPRTQDKNLINKLILKHRLDIFKISSESLQNLSNIKTVFYNTEYSKLITMFFMHVIIYSIDNPMCNMIGTIQNVCTIVNNSRLCSQMSAITTLNDAIRGTYGSNLPTYFSFVLTRIFLQIYMEKRNITEEYLLSELAKLDKVSESMCRDILDINSQCYTILLSEIPNSPLHTKILKDVNKMTKTKFMDNFTPPVSSSGTTSDVTNNNAGSVSTVSDPNANSEVFTTLDDFLQMNAFSEIYEVLWGDLDDSSPEIHENSNLAE